MGNKPNFSGTWTLLAKVFGPFKHSCSLLYTKHLLYFLEASDATSLHSVWLFHIFKRSWKPGMFDLGIGQEVGILYQLRNDTIFNMVISSFCGLMFLLVVNFKLCLSGSDNSINSFFSLPLFPCVWSKRLCVLQICFLEYMTWSELNCFYVSFVFCRWTLKKPMWLCCHMCL